MSGKGSDKSEDFQSVAESQMTQHRSLSISEGIKKVLNEFSNRATFKGAAVQVIDAESMDVLATRVMEVLSTDADTTVPKSTLAELSAQLAKIRLEANNFKDRAEKAEFAKSEADTTLAALQKELAKFKVEANAQVSKLKSDKASYDMDKVQAQAALKELRAHMKAFPEGTSLVQREEVAEQHDNLSQQVTSLNNAAQKANAQIQKLRQKEILLEKHILSLSNEINIARASIPAMKPTGGKSFAEVAKAAGTANVDLTKAAFSLLDKKSMDKLRKAYESTDGVKDKLFWLKAGLQNAKNSLFRGYYNVAEVLHKECLLMDYSSRSKTLAHIVDNMLTEMETELDGDEKSVRMKYYCKTSPDQMRLKPALAKVVGATYLSQAYLKGWDLDDLVDLEKRLHTKTFTKVQEPPSKAEKEENSWAEIFPEVDPAGVPLPPPTPDENPQGWWRRFLFGTSALFASLSFIGKSLWAPMGKFFSMINVFK
jgi:hypothetical protein